MTIPTQTSGCKAIEGCDKKHSCLRHQIYMETGCRSWNAHQMCRLNEFVKNDYRYFIEIKEEQ